MTNFEKITQDERELANWFCDRVDCYMCPVWGKCFYNDDKPHTQFIYEWLRSEEKAKKSSVNE